MFHGMHLDLRRGFQGSDMRSIHRPQTIGGPNDNLVTMCAFASDRAPFILSTWDGNKDRTVVIIAGGQPKNWQPVASQLETIAWTEQNEGGWVSRLKVVDPTAQWSTIAAWVLNARYTLFPNGTAMQEFIDLDIQHLYPAGMHRGLLMPSLMDLTTLSCHAKRVWFKRYTDRIRLV